MANTVILITDGPSEVGLHEAGRIARLHPATQVYVLVSDGAGVADAVFDRLHPFERTLLIDGAVPDDSWTRIARHWHDVHRLAHPADSPGREVTRRPWGELDSFIRQDNILQLRSVMSAIVRLGRGWVPGRSVRPGSFVELTAADLRQVARDEHTRWYERRHRTGWSVPGANKDGGGGRADAIVRPWSELADQLRDRACQQVSSQVAQLEAVGFMPVLPSGGPARAARFSRIGEVRAKRLTAENMWRNPAGEEFRAAPGDWLVVDDAGQERTVRDGEFQASHVLVAGDRWRRTGNVLAWQVAEPTSVRTLEGRATAQPGDWIVQGPRGERWPVLDAHFARGYLPEGPPGRLNTGDVTAASSVTL